MASFSYAAIDRSGRRRRGRLDAPTRGALEESLTREGLVLVDVREAEVADQRRGRRPPHRDFLEATRSVSALLGAGLPLAEALATTRAVVGPRMDAVLADVEARVGRGDALAAALEAQGGLFPPAYVGVVRAGERSGELAGAFQRLADRLEREAELHGRILSAALYPMILAVLGGLSLLVVVFLVVPRFAELIVDTGATLPATTAALVGLSAFVRAYGAWLLVLAGAAAIGGTAWMTTATGRLTLAGALLRAPLVGTIRREVLAGRFARLLGSLLAGGAPVVSALDATAASVGDPRARAATLDARARVREGATLRAALAATGFFPELLTRLVAVGEEAGDLPVFLGKAADVLEQRTQRAVQRAVTLLEPAMIVAFGGAIAVVAFSLLQAIYGVNAGAFR